MKVSRIRIEHFKQFREPLEINDLMPGINLISGPNEVGRPFAPPFSSVIVRPVPTRFGRGVTVLPRHR